MFIKITKKLVVTITGHLWLSSILAMAAGTIVGFYSRPEILKSFIPFIIFMMLYPVMLDVNYKEVKKNLLNPKLLITSLVFNFIFAPVLIYVLSVLFLSNSAPSIYVSLILFGIIPCGSMAPAYTSMAKGNANQSVTIMVVSLILSIALVPLLTNVLLGTIVPVPIGLIMKQLILIILVPWILAGLTKKIIVIKYDDVTFDRVKANLKHLSGVGVIILQFIIFILNGKMILAKPTLLLELVVPTLLFLIVLLICANIYCKIKGESKENRIALSFSTTAKNISISLTLGYAAFGSEVALLIAIMGPFIQFPVMMTYLSIIKNSNKSLVFQEDA